MYFCNYNQKTPVSFRNALVNSRHHITDKVLQTLYILMHLPMYFYLDTINPKIKFLYGKILSWKTSPRINYHLSLEAGFLVIKCMFVSLFFRVWLVYY